MKRFLPLLAALVLPAAIEAESIGPAEAASIAEGFMQQLAPGTAGRTLQKAPVRNALPEENQPYYIFNAGTGGYVIVAGDDRLGSVLGYSDSGSIDPDNAPEGLRGLLGLYETAYMAVSASAAPAADITPASPSVMVAPLLGDINWGQDTPFNLMTPTYTSGSAAKNYYTGCVACAATQIMRLYTWPPQGSGSKTYTDPLSGKTLSADFGTTQYDWANMPAVVPDRPTTAQADAYSTLAAQMGIAIEMQYEASGSGTYDMLVPYALRTYFGYDAAVRSHNRTYYSTGEWMDMIKAELDAGRPVFYGGSSDSGNGGHAFVIDGYDSADYVHVNWGWYGSSNGFFMINHLDPSSLGEGGGAGGYNLNQDMVTGIQPARQGSVRDHSVYGATRMSIDGPFGDKFTLMTYLENIDVEPFSGQVEALLTDADNNIVATLGGENVTVAGFAKGFAGTLLFNPKNVGSAVSGVADGKYRIRLGYKTGTDDSWTLLRHPKGLPAYADVTVYRGTISISAKHTPAPDGVLREAMTTDGDLYAGGTALIRFTVENRSADFAISKITLRLTDVNNPSAIFDATLDKTVYDQSTEAVELLMPVDADIPAGNYFLTALVKNGDVEYPFDDTDAGRTVVKVLPAADGPVVRAASDMVWRSNISDGSDGTISQGDTFYGIISLRNAAAPGTAPVLARFVNESTGESSPFVQVNVNFADTRSQTVTFGRYLPFDPGTYRVELYQTGEDFTETPVPVYKNATLVTIEASDALTAEMVAFDMPSHLNQGTRVACSLTYRGLDAGRQNLYIRLRQFTNSGGEIAYMGSQTFAVGTENSLSFNYTPGKTLADGLYMVLAETGSSSSQRPLGNYAAYGRVISMGNVSGIDIVKAEEKAAAIWLEGTTLRVVPAGDNTVTALTIYNVAGTAVLRDNCDLSTLPSGLYIVEAVLSNGYRATAKIAL